MEQTLSRISDLGRMFLNKHVLKRQGAAPGRPGRAAPELPGRAAQAQAQPQVQVEAGAVPAVEMAVQEAGGAQAAAAAAAAQYMTEEEVQTLSAPPAAPGPSYATEEEINAGWANEGDDDSDSDDEPDYEEKYRAPVKHAVVTADATQTGMKTKAPGAEYEGEYNTYGWRGNAQSKDRTDTVTRLYSEEEQKQSELVMKKDGTFRVNEGTFGYAMDGAGRMVAFQEDQNVLATPQADGTESRDDAKFNGPLQPGQRLENVHHSSVLGGDTVVDADGKPVLDATGKPMMKGREAASAGFVTFDWNGRMTHISNCSGHYKPAVEYLVQAIEHLTKQGVFFRNEVTHADGTPLDGDSKESELFFATKEKLKEAGLKASEIEALTAALQNAEAEGDEKAQASLGAKIKEVSESLVTLTKRLEGAQKLLGKLGIGPSMRMAGTAEFVDAKAGMTGLDVRTGTTYQMSVEEFLRSGGGNRAQKTLKAGVLQEVVASGRLGQGDLDRLGELIAKPPPWTRAETAEVTRLKNAWDNALADVEAEGRRKAAGPGVAPAPGAVDDALYELGKR